MFWVGLRIFRDFASFVPFVIQQGHFWVRFRAFPQFISSVFFRDRLCAQKMARSEASV